MTDATELTVPDIARMNVFSMFTDYGSFKVPSYQRQYAWGEEETEALFDDFLEFHKELNVNGSSFYILGQSIFAPNKDADKSSYSLAIVDGQQRLTTLYLFAIAIKKWLGLHGISGQGNSDSDIIYRALNQVLFATNTLTGTQTKRLQVAYGGDDYVDDLLNDASLPDFGENDTQENIKANFQFLEEKIKSNFSAGLELAEFAHTLLYKVWVIATKISSESQALEIFEKINSRGKALNSAELLKNLLFRNAREQDFKTISDQWNLAADAMFKVRPTRAAGMQFLMKSLLGARQGHGTSNRLVFTEWRKELGASNQDPVSFAKEVAQSAKFVSAIATSGRNDKNIELYACRRFSTVQHLPLIIASQSFSSNRGLYKNFLKFLDTRFLISLLAKEPSQNLERAIWPWAMNLAALDENSSPAELLAACAPALDELEAWQTQARTNFLRNLDYTRSSHAKQIKYVLACVAWQVEAELGDSGDFDIDSIFAPKAYDLDHIFPKSMVHAADFDLSHGKTWVHQPGNLALLFSDDNRVQGSALPAKKTLNYGTSKLFITATLAADDNINGLNDRKAAVLTKLRKDGFAPVGREWHASQSESRAEAYWKVFERYLEARLDITS